MSVFTESLPATIHTLELEVNEFKRGRLKRFQPEWKKLTSDPEILEMVAGARIELDCDIDSLTSASKLQSRMNENEAAAVDSEVEQ